MEYGEADHLQNEDEDQFGEQEEVDIQFEETPRQQNH